MRAWLKSLTRLDFVVIITMTVMLGIILFAFVNLSARNARLERTIDVVRSQYQDQLDSQLVTECRTALSASAQSELLRGQADLLDALAQVARDTLGPEDVDRIVARSAAQRAEADRREQTLAICDPDSDELPSATTAPGIANPNP